MGSQLMLVVGRRSSRAEKAGGNSESGKAEAEQGKQDDGKDNHRGGR